LMALFIIQFSTASDIEKLLRGADLTVKELSKAQIENIAKLLKPKILKDQGIALKENHDQILHKLKNKNQLFLITYLLNAKEFLTLASSSKEFFEKIGGNLEKLQNHLNCDFIADFAIYFALPFPDSTLSVMEYFHMFSLHFGTEICYSPQYFDYLRIEDIAVRKIDESSYGIALSGGDHVDVKVANGDIFMVMKFAPNEKKFELKFGEHNPFVWEKNGKLYNYWNENIRKLLEKPQLDFDKRIFTSPWIESSEYKACMSISPANFRKYIRKYPLLDLCK